MMNRGAIATVVSVVTLASVVTTTSGGAAPSSSPPAVAEGTTTVPLIHLGTTPPLTTLSDAAARIVPKEAKESPDAMRARLRPRIGAGGAPQIVAPPLPDPPSPPSARVSNQLPGLVSSWQGLNSFDTGWANNGNSFFIEPPDQGLCVSSDFVFESTNSVIQAYTPAGKALLPGNSGIPGTEPVGLSHNEFYGFPPVFSPTDPPTFGPFTTDPSCYYDPVLRRWFHVVLTIQQDEQSGDFTGENSLDIAVSQSANPTGRWDIYRIPAENNGTDGTPNHHCDKGFCIADYPHIGADKHGFYITTNEYSFLGEGYTGAQLYALPKESLVAGNATEVVLLENLRVPSLDQRGFTVRPAWSRPESWDTRKGGVEYFVSSTAGDGSETGNMTGKSDDMVVWALTNTSSLEGRADMELDQVVEETIRYQLPPLSLQKEGPTPFLRCLNLGVDCIFGEDFGRQRGPYPLDSSDTRVTSSFMADGVLWTSLTTALAGPGGADYDSTDGSFRPINQRAGVAYFAFRPRWDDGELEAKLLQDGYVAAQKANLTFPSLAVTEANVGFMGVSLVGPNHFPSAAYIPLSLGDDPDVVHVAAHGRAPSDGFSGTVFGGFRPRWQDYGYMVPGADPNELWFGVEYIAEECGFAEWLADPNCGDERTPFTNWSTRVTRLRV